MPDEKPTKPKRKSTPRPKRVYRLQVEQTYTEWRYINGLQKRVKAAMGPSYQVTKRMLVVTALKALDMALNDASKLDELRKAADDSKHDLETETVNPKG